MKILQVTPRYPPQTGGVETHVRAVSERLVDRGHEVTVRTADASADGGRRERRSGVTVRRHYGAAPGDSFHFAPGIAPAVRHSNADIIHAHNYHSFPLAFAAVSATGAHLFMTTHYHGESAATLRDRLLLLYRPVGKWAVRQADTVVAVSEWEREKLRDDFGVEATVLHNGLDIDRFQQAEPVVRDRPYLLCVGRLEEYKGVQWVIRALPELPKYDLLVVGTGEYGEQLEKIAERESVTDRVEFLGYVDESRLPGLYAGADLHLTLSEFEAYGMTVGEALAAGTPCVVRNTAALSDWTDRSGVEGIDNLSPRAVATAVQNAVGTAPDPETIQTWGEVARSLEEIYEKSRDT